MKTLLLFYSISPVALSRSLFSYPFHPMTICVLTARGRTKLEYTKEREIDQK